MKKEKYLLGLLSHRIWVFVGDMKDSCILQRSQSIKVVNQDPCSKYNVVGPLLLLGIKSRKKFEVWNFLQVCIWSFRSEMSPRHGSQASDDLPSGNPGFVIPLTYFSFATEYPSCQMKSQNQGAWTSLTQMYVSLAQTILHCSYSMLIQKKDEKNGYYLDSWSSLQGGAILHFPL